MVCQPEFVADAGICLLCCYTRLNLIELMACEDKSQSNLSKKMTSNCTYVYTSYFSYFVVITCKIVKLYSLEKYTTTKDVITSVLLWFIVMR